MIGSSNFRAVVKCQVREEVPDTWLYCGHRNVVKGEGGRIASIGGAAEGGEIVTAKSSRPVLKASQNLRECVGNTTQRITHLLLFLPP